MPEQTGRKQSPPMHTSVNPANGPSQASDSWLGNGMAPDRRDGLSILDAIEMTTTLNDFLAAVENDNGLWGMDASPGTSDPSLHGTCDAGADPSKRDFSHILDNFL
ncbi:hypothetical protein NW762_010557 [Fusarium torreyae]|uniref:Uncharacterized protein n=1 Tax=Fusarium torreyae TaxID=1237075 RepID=A0A9W8RRH1_9HYPO|nr:hypothetical protein NW762_010557 [Fusarium torreyae]